MAVAWGQIYTDVAQILLEGPSLSLGLITDAQFYLMASEVYTDFLSRSGLALKIWDLPLHFSIGTYQAPDGLADIQAVGAAGMSLQRTSGYYLDNSNPNWETAIGVPDSFREDELLPQQVEITPAPAFEGTQIYTNNPGYGPIAASGPLSTSQWGIGYGQISGTVGIETTFIVAAVGGYGTIYLMTGNPTPQINLTNNGYGVLNTFEAVDNGQLVLDGAGSSQTTEFVITPDPSTPTGWGTWAAASGNPFVEPVGFTGFGIMAAMVPSTANLQVFGTAINSNAAPLNATTVIAGIPDSLTPYLKYGILQRIFSTDGELKDEAKASYCEARYNEGLEFLSAVLGTEGVSAQQ